MFTKNHTNHIVNSNSISESPWDKTDWSQVDLYEPAQVPTTTTASKAASANTPDISKEMVYPGIKKLGSGKGGGDTLEDGLVYPGVRRLPGPSEDTRCLPGSLGLGPGLPEDTAHRASSPSCLLGGIGLHPQVNSSNDNLLKTNANLIHIC